ncbi:hypothetical protein OENI_670003 [Oenococcus oeni]|nr:hypothetical protein OENI_670003 [Oenococcus oeni]
MLLKERNRLSHLSVEAVTDVLSEELEADEKELPLCSSIFV